VGWIGHTSGQKKMIDKRIEIGRKTKRAEFDFKFKRRKMKEKTRREARQFECSPPCRAKICGVNFFTASGLHFRDDKMTCSGRGDFG
jgi:hypothetical protein